MAKCALLLLLAGWLLAGQLWLGAGARAAPYGVKLCGREFIRAVIFTCGGSRWRRSGVLAHEAMGEAGRTVWSRAQGVQGARERGAGARGPRSRAPSLPRSAGAPCPALKPWPGSQGSAEPPGREGGQLAAPEAISRVPTGCPARAKRGSWGSQIEALPGPFGQVG